MPTILEIRRGSAAHAILLADCESIMEIMRK